jgi:hypothetical protein
MTILLMRHYNYQKLARENTDGREFNENGRCMVLRNIMSYIKDDSEKLQLELVKHDADAWIYNALIFRVVTEVRNILDSVARYCENLYPSAAYTANNGDINFFTYTFERTEVQKIHYLQFKMKDLKYDGQSFTHFANKLKHEYPWIGRVTTSDECFKTDILDKSNIGFVHDFTVPIVDYTVNIIAILTKIILK